jgi:hypothetical protein
VEGVARVVPLDDIAANDHNLNIPRYVAPKDEREVLTVEVAMKNLEESARAALVAEEKLIGILMREGLLVANDLANRGSRWLTTDASIKLFPTFAPYAAGFARIYLHRWILETPEFLWVNHKDFDGLNCIDNNIEEVTPDENRRYRVNRNRRKKRKPVTLKRGKDGQQN